MSQIIDNTEWGPFGEKKLKKSLTMPKKLKGGPLGLFNIRSVGNLQKIEVGTFGDIFFGKKSRGRKKTERGGTENALREYPLVPLSFLDNVKKLLRKLIKNCKKL